MALKTPLATPPAKRRRWYQFSLRTLIVCVALISILLGAFAIRLQRAREQAEAVAGLRRYGYVVYDSRWRRDDKLEVIWEPTSKSLIPSLLIDWLGPDFFQSATSVCIRLPELPDDGSGDEQRAVWEGLGRLRSLDHLSIQIPSGSATQFTRLGLASNLRHLSVGGTVVRVGAEDARALKRFSGLESLNLRNCMFEPGSLPPLGELPSLALLDLSGSNVEDGEIAILSQCRGLRSLDLSQTNISDEGLRIVGSLPKLAILELDHTPISDDGLSQLGRLANLRSISLGNTPVTDAGIRYLEKLPALTTLDLRGTKVKGTTLDGLRALERIDLSNTDADDEALIAIANLPAIKHIDVSGTKVTNHGVSQFRALRPDVHLDGP
jgi:Leucine-rich repeat (LRR) protein